MASRVLCLGLSLASSAILARALGPYGKGIVATALTLTQMVFLLSQLALSHGTVFHVAQREHSILAILGSNYVIGLLLSLVGTAVGLLVVFPFHERVFPQVPLSLLLLALAVVPLRSVNRLVRSTFLGQRRFALYNATEVISSIVNVALISLFVLALQQGIHGGLLATLSGAAAMTAILTLIAVRTWGWARPRVDRSYARAAIGFGLQAYVGNVLTYLYLRFDLILVNLFRGPGEAGLYSVAVVVAEQVSIVSQTASNVLFPHIAGERNEDVRRTLTPLVARTVLVVSLLGGVALLVASPWLMTVLFSSSYSAAVRPLWLLLPGILCLTVARVLGIDLAGRGKPVLNTYVSIASVAINMGLNVLLIPRYGMSGAAIASSFAYAITLGARVSLYTRISGVRWTHLFVPQRGDLAVYRAALQRILDRSRARHAVREQDDQTL